MAYPRYSLVLITADEILADELERLLRSHGYGLTVTATALQAMRDIHRTSPALILADRHMIEQQRLRRDQLPWSVPVIVVHRFDGSGDGEDRLSDLEAGFDLSLCTSRTREIIAHIRAILRRQERLAEPPSRLRIEGLSMDLSRHEVTVRDRLVELTPKEFRILHQFLRAPGTVLSRQELLNRVWGEDYALEEHALDVHIHALRQKIERDSSRPDFIVTIRGVGYKLLHSSPPIPDSGQ